MHFAWQARGMMMLDVLDAGRVEGVCFFSSSGYRA